MLVLSCILIYFKKVRTINRDIKHVSSFYILFCIICGADIDTYVHTHMHCAYTHGQTDTEQLTLSFLPPHLQKYTRGNEYRVSWVQPTLAKSLGSPRHNEHWYTYLCFSICIHYQGYMRLCSLLSTSDLIIKKKICLILAFPPQWKSVAAATL